MAIAVFVDIVIDDMCVLQAPSRAFYMLWVNILAPWFFAEAPEVDEKKNKKAERRMKRR